MQAARQAQRKRQMLPVLAQVRRLLRVAAAQQAQANLPQALPVLAQRQAPHLPVWAAQRQRAQVHRLQAPHLPQAGKAAQRQAAQAAQRRKAAHLQQAQQAGRVPRLRVAPAGKVARLRVAQQAQAHNLPHRQAQRAQQVARRQVLRAAAPHRAQRQLPAQAVGNLGNLVQAPLAELQQVLRRQLQRLAHKPLPCHRRR